MLLVTKVIPVSFFVKFDFNCDNLVKEGKFLIQHKMLLHSNSGPRIYILIEIKISYYPVFIFQLNWIVFYLPQYVHLHHVLETFVANGFCFNKTESLMFVISSANLLRWKNHIHSRESRKLYKKYIMFKLFA